ncbi:hypothetical protein Lal_00041101, partial [Lupinus albus]
MFINTLQPPFFDRMIGNINSDFYRLITIWDKIENRFENNKIKKNFANKICKRKPHSQRSSANLKRLIFQKHHVLPLQMVEKGGPENEKGRKVEPPYPQGINPNASCVYHTGEIGHFTEDCDQLKSKVQYLINSRLIRFQGNVL